MCARGFVTRGSGLLSVPLPEKPCLPNACAISVATTLCIKLADRGTLQERHLEGSSKTYAPFVISGATVLLKRCSSSKSLAICKPTSRKASVRQGLSGPLSRPIALRQGTRGSSSQEYLHRIHKKDFLPVAFRGYIVIMEKKMETTIT